MNLQARHLTPPQAYTTTGQVVYPIQIVGLHVVLATNGGLADDVDIVLNGNMEVLDVQVAKDAVAGGGADTVQIAKGTVATPITDAMTLPAAGNTLVNPILITLTNNQFVVGETLRIARNAGGGNNACTIDIFGVSYAATNPQRQKNLKDRHFVSPGTGVAATGSAEALGIGGLLFEIPDVGGDYDFVMGQAFEALDVVVIRRLATGGAGDTLTITNQTAGVDLTNAAAQLGNVVIYTPVTKGVGGIITTWGVNSATATAFAAGDTLRITVARATLACALRILLIGIPK